MDVRTVSVVLLSFVMVAVSCSAATAAEDAERSTTYIVHMDKSVMPHEFATHHHWYNSLLSSVRGVSRDQTIKDEDLFLYIYDNVMDGFGAKLTQSEVDMLEEMPGHVMSYPDPSGAMDTTHSTEFLGLGSNSGLLPKSRFGQDVIVGVVDTGIWPESRSFNDNEMEPVPTRWKGTCGNDTAFSPSLCNRKLVGARYFNKGYIAKYGKIDPKQDYDSPRDSDGHGSHTSSTVGGNYVDDVDYYGFAPGTARGVAPQGRLAMYKVIWYNGAMGSDVLAAMESAITDGVDVFSMSLGFDSTPYFKDIIAIGAFEAIKRGVLVVCSMGNTGLRGRLHNGAPWIMTIAASTLDRDFAPFLMLGDGTVLKGSSFYLYADAILNVSQAPLLYQSNDPACKKVDNTTMKGKVVLCVNMDYEQAAPIQGAGATGLISVTDNDTRRMSPYDNFPVAIVKTHEGEAVVRYASSATNPIVDMIFNMTVLGIKPAPAVAAFSSRGPNPPSPNILKPDITAPGVNILAAWRSNDTDEPDYNMISGTSMSCPHVAGVSALVKSVHRDWSPAAIRSAIMTTAYTIDNSNNPFLDLGNISRPATPLEFGAGHIDPEKAIDPGLVYDLGIEDYVNFLCTLNYTVSQIQIITKSSVACPTGADLGSDALNYPSFTAIFFKNKTSAASATFRRTLTNVGDSEFRYNAVVEAPRGLRVTVEPLLLEFKGKSEKLNFTVTMEVEEWGSAEDEDVRFGYLSWIDNQNHVVKSPLLTLFE